MNDEQILAQCAIRSYAGNGDDTAPTAFRVSQDSRMVVVADAVGHRARATGAAHRATRAVIEALPRIRGGKLDLAAEVRRALDAANAAIYLEDPSRDHVTAPDAVSAAVIAMRGSEVVIASIGDVRCYRARAGNVSLMTRDHSAVAAARSEVVPTHAQEPMDAFEIHHRNVLTRALGLGLSIEPDLTVRTAREGDRYVLCSAGLWTQLRAEELCLALAQARNGDDACQALRTHVRSEDLAYAIAAIELVGIGAAATS